VLVSGYVVQAAGYKDEAKGRERRVEPNCIRLKRPARVWKTWQSLENKQVPYIRTRGRRSRQRAKSGEHGAKGRECRAELHSAEKVCQRSPKGTPIAGEPAFPP